MAFELAKAYVSVGVDDRLVKPGLDKLRTTFSSAVSQMTQIAAGFGIATSVPAAISAITSATQEWMALAKVQIQAEQRLSGVVRATGGSVGYTTDQLKRMASELQNVTTVGDEAILGTMSKLLTFRSVTGDVFKRATELSLDLAATGLGSAESASIMLGKALEDPVRGLTAMRRVGVSFSAVQEANIKQLAEQNRLWEAQTMILDAVAMQVGGVARELSKTDVGMAEQLANAIGDMKESLGKELLPGTVGWYLFKYEAYQAAINYIKLLKTVIDPLSLVRTNELPGDVGIRARANAAVREQQIMERRRAEFVRLGLEPWRAETMTGTPEEAARQYRTNQAQLQYYVKLDRQIEAEKKRRDDWNRLVERLGPLGQGLSVQGGGMLAISKMIGAGIGDALQRGGRGTFQAFFGRKIGKDDTSIRQTPWNRIMGIEDLNRSMQEALLQDNPVLETNKILSTVGVKIRELPKGALGAAGDVAAGWATAAQAISSAIWSAVAIARDP